MVRSFSWHICLSVTVYTYHESNGVTCAQSPGEIKRREVSWTHEEASPEEIKSREVALGYRERVGLLLLQLFPNGGATDRIL